MSNRINVTRKASLLDLTRFNEGQFPTTYLEAPIFPGRPKIIYFPYLVDNISSKMVGWTKRFLSISGWATLISSVLGSLSIHTLSIIPVPKGCIRRMESLMANFLCDSGSVSKRHWIKLSSICNPKDEGGLGRKKLSNVNTSVLAKPSSFAIWRAIQPLIHRLRSESYWVVGRGDTFINHLCEWLNVPVPPEGVGWTISDVVKNADIRDLFVALLPPVFRNIVDSFVLNDQSDKLLWKVSSNGSFLVNQYYLAK
ncbi:hypothetical protein QQ045_014110 [Rhodiola kirilowii]